MGTKPDMLRKYLTIVGLGAILFGVVFFLLTTISSVKAISKFEAPIRDSLTDWEKFFFILTAAQSYGFQMFQSLTLGGVCLYLAHKLGTSHD